MSVKSHIKNLLKKGNSLFSTQIHTIFNLNVVEVGARGGPSNEFYNLANIINYYGFEPEVDEYKKLVSKSKKTIFKSEKYLPCTVGINNEKKIFNIYSRESCSSILEADLDKARIYSREDYYKLIKKIPVITRSLDSLLFEGKLSGNISVLKLDTQGSELEILKNSMSVLKTVKAIRVEVSFMPIYKEQPLFFDINEFLERQEFSFQGFLESHYWNHYTPNKRQRKKSLRCIPFTRSSICHADALYFKTPLEVSEKYGENNFEEIIKLVFVYIMYQYYDKAYYLMEKTGLNNLAIKNIGIDLYKLISSMSQHDYYCSKINKLRFISFSQIWKKLSKIFK